jgi:hypothetical protein
MTEKKSEYVRIKRKDREEEKAYIKKLEEIIEVQSEVVDFSVVLQYLEIDAEKFFFDVTNTELAERRGIPRTTYNDQMKKVKTLAQEAIKNKNITNDHLTELRKKAYGGLLARKGLLNAVSPSDVILLNIYSDPEFRKLFEKNKTWAPLIPKILKLNIGEILGYDDDGAKQRV